MGKDIFIIWIMFQLIVLGFGSVLMHNEMVRGEYNCSRETVPALIGIIFPLVVFANDVYIHKQYCGELYDKQHNQL